MIRKKVDIDTGMLVINNGEELPAIGVSVYANGNIIVLKQGDSNVTVSISSLNTLTQSLSDILKGER